MMTDDELIREHIRADPAPEAILIKVWEIEWDGSHTPVVTWRTVSELPVNAAAESILRAQEKALRDERYFRVCPECNERKPSGHMLEDCCQSCGEKNHGIVF